MLRYSSSRARQAAYRGQPPRLRQGYTLVEIMVSTALTLMVLLAVIQVFGTVSASISDARRLVEKTDQLRSVSLQLKRDLEGVTCVMNPPRDAASDEGYLEYIEGPVGPFYRPEEAYRNIDIPRVPTSGIDEKNVEKDSTVGDNDDILLFTTRSSSEPFVGRYGTTAVQSPVAEVAWFVRGRTLYRRMLLVAPELQSSADTNGDGVISRVELGNQSFYNQGDLSGHPVWFNNNGTWEIGWELNTLGDLTKRENRFAHCRLPVPTTAHPGGDSFPFDVRRWGQLGLPTLGECSHANWMYKDPTGNAWADLTKMPGVTDITLDPTATSASVIPWDLWRSPHPWSSDTLADNAQVDPTTGNFTDYVGPRIGEDVVLTNVIGFDVKAWDPNAPLIGLTNSANTASTLVIPGDTGYTPARVATAVAGSDPKIWICGYGAYVDLLYAQGQASSVFDKAPDNKSQLNTGNTPEYDTWSTHYEHDGIDEDGDGSTDEGTDGFDSDANGVVDDPGEQETSPPYVASLRGIQVKIRVYEPDSRQVREVTISQTFRAQ